MLKRRRVALLCGSLGIRKIRINELLFVEALWGHAINKRNNLNNKYLLGIRKNTDVFDTSWLITGLSKAQLLLRSIKAIKGEILVVTEPDVWKIRSKICNVHIGDWVSGSLSNFWVLRAIKQLPDCVVILTFDDEKLQQVVSEAVQMRVPVIVALDSNNNPLNVGYPIPMNNNSLEALRRIGAFLYGSMAQGHSCYYRKFKKKVRVIGSGGSRRKPGRGKAKGFKGRVTRYLKIKKESNGK